MLFLKILTIALGLFAIASQSMEVLLFCCLPLAFVAWDCDF